MSLGMVTCCYLLCPPSLRTFSILSLFSRLSGQNSTLENVFNTSPVVPLYLVSASPLRFRKTASRRFVISVGYFEIPFSDERIIDKINVAEKNLTDFDCLYEK